MSLTRNSQFPSIDLDRRPTQNAEIPNYGGQLSMMREFTDEDIQAMDANIIELNNVIRKYQRKRTEALRHLKAIQDCVRKRNTNKMTVAFLAKIYPTTDDISTERAARRSKRPLLGWDIRTAQAL